MPHKSFLAPLLCRMSCVFGSRCRIGSETAIDPEGSLWFFPISGRSSVKSGFTTTIPRDLFVRGNHGVSVELRQFTWAGDPVGQTLLQRRNGFQASLCDVAGRDA
jgi:hypothetical protein